MSRCGLVIDPRFEEHDTGAGHPERPARLERVRERVERSGLEDRCRKVPPAAAADELLLRVHDAGHLRRVREACERGERLLDAMDTAICPASERIARLAAGSLAALCDEVVAGSLDRGFAALRPPGHHAERDLAMGFCLFNNAAAAAAHLRDRHGLERVMVVDWDVHHGNGTQHIFEEDPSVFFYSSHQFPLYPGTGRADERGRGAGEGATLNCPLPPGAGDEEFLGVLRERLVPAARDFRPQFVLVSAGFDAHAADPLAQLEVSTEAFAEATRIVREIAEQHCRGRVVSTLEGGYDLDALAESVSAHLEVMAGD